MKTTTRALSALMLGLSLCGGLLTTAHAAPAGGNPQARPDALKGKNKGERGERGMKMMAELNLTDAQKAKLKPIMEATRAQMKAMREDTTMSREDKMAKMKAMRATNETKINAILTPTQQKKLAELKAARKAQGKHDGQGKGKRGEGHGPQAPVA